MKCFNPHCDNEVPEGWEGGFCPPCLAQIEEIENRDEGDFDADSAEEAEIIDPYEEYGFDHHWEV